MAQVNMTSTITATGLTSDTISSTVQKVATVTTGGIARTTVVPTAIGSATVLLAAAATASAYVYLKNASAGWVRLRTTATAANDEVYLAAGDWTLFPWTAAVDIKAYAQNANSLVEHGVFF